MYNENHLFESNGPWKKKKERLPKNLIGNLIGKQREKRKRKEIVRNQAEYTCNFAGSSPAGIYAHLVLD